MKLSNQRQIKLAVEQLEDRLVPAYLTNAPQAVTIAGISDSDRLVFGYEFQLQASIVTTSDRYGVTDGNGNGQWQAVTSTPSPFQQVRSPTDAEWSVLESYFPGMGFAPSLGTLADNSLIIRDTEALGPSRQDPIERFNRPGVGQSLFISYNPTGVDPCGCDINWLQFVTTNAAFEDAHGLGGSAGSPGIDTRNSDTPFYDVSGFTADATGFVDIPQAPEALDLYNFHADMFPVSVRDLGNGASVYIVWQGISWGWQTGRAAPRVAGLNANSGSTVGGYALTIGGDGFAGASSVFFGSVAASSFTVNSDTSITAIVPAESAGMVDVTVTNSGGTSATSSSDQFTFVAPPSLSINNVSLAEGNSGMTSSRLPSH